MYSVNGVRSSSVLNLLVLLFLVLNLTVLSFPVLKYFVLNVRVRNESVLYCPVPISLRWRPETSRS